MKIRYSSPENNESLYFESRVRKTGGRVIENLEHYELFLKKIYFIPSYSDRPQSVLLNYSFTYADFQHMLLHFLHQAESIPFPPYWSFLSSSLDKQTVLHLSSHSISNNCVMLKQSGPKPCS